MELYRFKDILIDLSEVRLLVGHHVTFKDGTENDVGVEAADAMRSIFTEPTRPTRLTRPTNAL